MFLSKKIHFTAIKNIQKVLKTFQKLCCFKVKNVLAEYENTKFSACGGQIVKIFQNVSKKKFSKRI